MTDKMIATIDVDTGNLFAKLSDDNYITFHNFTLREAQDFCNLRALAELVPGLVDTLEGIKSAFSIHGDKFGKTIECIDESLAAARRVMDETNTEKEK